jgi:hypothetical protein
MFPFEASALPAGAGAGARVVVLAVEDDVVAAAKGLAGLELIRAGGALVGGDRPDREKRAQSEQSGAATEVDQLLPHGISFSCSRLLIALS